MCAEKNTNHHEHSAEASLEEAILQLKAFTDPEASKFELDEDGKIKAIRQDSLKKLMELAQNYVAPLFSEEARARKELKLSRLKHAVLEVLDTIKSYSSILERLKKGNLEQKKLAQRALDAIEGYNRILDDENAPYNRSNSEREFILLDHEIKGKKIELPFTVTVRKASHEDSPFGVFNKVHFGLAQTKNTHYVFQSKYQEASQLVIDAFRVKARGLIQEYLEEPALLEEVFDLIKTVPVEIEEKSDEDVIHVRQHFEIGPGLWIYVTGLFKNNRNMTQTKFITMAVSNSFKMSFQRTHSGYPFPSQHLGWALGSSWVEANPLRIEPSTLFHQVNIQKKDLASRLLFNPEFSQKARYYVKMKMKVFNEEAHFFLDKHKKLQKVIRREFGLDETEEETEIFETFYDSILNEMSPYNVLVNIHQRLIDMFIKTPFQLIEEEWLETPQTPLRGKNIKEKQEAVISRLESYRKLACERLDVEDSYEAYLLLQGTLLGECFQSIALQYLSERIGFAPPLLDDFERKLQICAFEQLFYFMEECKDCLDNPLPEIIKSRLAIGLDKEITLLESMACERDSLSQLIVDELEVYFNLRHFKPTDR